MFKILNTPEYHIDKASELMDKGDYQKAAKTLKPYAEKGYVIAMLYYANCLMQTDLYHFDEAIGWILEAKEAVDDPDIQAYADDLLSCISDSVNEQFAMGEKALAENRLKDAMEWYTLAAENNHRKAMYTLAGLYENRYVSLDMDEGPKLAIKWYTAAAELGHVDSMCKLAQIYHVGKYHDLEKAVYWYRQAADRGDFDSLHILEVINK